MLSVFSWVCFRAQTLEQFEHDTESISVQKSYTSATNWCAEADDWGDGNANVGEENGNLVASGEKISDEEEESCSLEESVRAGFGNLNFDDKNANPGTETQGKRILTVTVTLAYYIKKKKKII